jgi:lysophospholipase L1-like esterase
MPRARLTVIGDSFVEGRGDPTGEGGYSGWVPLFASLFGIPRHGYLNLGTHGATTQDVVDHQLKTALVNKSPLIGFVVGVNDLVMEYDPTRFRRNIETILTTLGGSDTVVFTATYPDIPFNLPLPASFRQLLRARFDTANECLRAATARAGAVCLDVADEPTWMDPGVWSADGIHPSPPGHRRFAEAMAALVSVATGMPIQDVPAESIGAGVGAKPLSY